MLLYGGAHHLQMPNLCTAGKRAKLTAGRAWYHHCLHLYTLRFSGKFFYRNSMGQVKNYYTICLEKPADFPYIAGRRFAAR